jgi:PTH1 family peptidyl-tRNA hydrolase
MPSSIQLIVGLGNPGKEYADTRHNVGALFVEKIAKDYKTTLKLEKKFQGYFAKATLFDKDCFLLIPTTFMNLSGQAVLAVANFYKILPESILIVHDDLDLPVGALRLKKDGGHGGHNGLKDIIQKLGTNEFNRIKIGIAHPGQKEKVTDHVLGKITKDEKIEIDEAINQAMTYLENLVTGN